MRGEYCFFGIKVWGEGHCLGVFESAKAMQLAGRRLALLGLTDQGRGLQFDLQPATKELWLEYRKWINGERNLPPMYEYRMVGKRMMHCYLDDQYACPWTESRDREEYRVVRFKGGHWIFNRAEADAILGEVYDWQPATEELGLEFYKWINGEREEPPRFLVGDDSVHCYSEDSNARKFA